MVTLNRNDSEYPKLSLTDLPVVSRIKVQELNPVATLIRTLVDYDQCSFSRLSKDFDRGFLLEETVESYINKFLLFENIHTVSDFDKAIKEYKDVVIITFEIAESTRTSIILNINHENVEESFYLLCSGDEVKEVKITYGIECVIKEIKLYFNLFNLTS